MSEKNVSGKIRVLVVDDSAFMRVAVKRVLESDERFEVVGQAKDGADAVVQARALKPDVITMDFNMPRMNGAEAVRAILAERPQPVVMLSAHTQKGAVETLEALSAGAVDFVTKPDGEVSTDLSHVKDELFRKLRAAARSRPTAAGVSSAPPPPVPASRPVYRTFSGASLLVVAVSTGGPAALERVIPRLPASLDVGIVVVQHMPAAFTRALAARLDGISALTVKEAQEGDRTLPGGVLIAPGDRHVVLDSAGAVKLADSPPVNGCRPSADVTLQAAARVFGSRLTALVMTGMGRDGAIGARAVKAAGGRVLVQDRATSVVWGMPRAVSEAGLADDELPLDDIAPKLVKLFG